MTDKKESLLARTGRRLLGEVPFLEPLALALSDAAEAKRRDQFQGFIGSLAKYVEGDNFDAVALYLTINANEPWMTENVIRGFRAILDAIDETAKECIAVLVADQINNEATPDRVYKQFATLFTESDAKSLRSMLLISDAFVRAGRPQFSDVLEVFHVGGEITFDLIVDDKAFPIQGWKDDQAFEEACEILSRGWFLAKPFGDRPSHPEKTVKDSHHLYCIREYQFELWNRLERYLKPLRASAP